MKLRKMNCYRSRKLWFVKPTTFLCASVFLDFILQKSSRFTAKLRARYRDFPNTPPPTHSLPIVTIPHQSSTFVTTDEPTLTNHYCTKSLVYIRVPFWCKSFGFGQMYNVMYHSKHLLHTLEWFWLHQSLLRVNYFNRSQSVSTHGKGIAVIFHCVQKGKH